MDNIYKVLVPIEFFIRAAIVAFILLAIWIVAAHATDCPAGVPSCKVMILTPQEEQMLTAPNGVFDNAQWANRSGLTSVVDAFREKIKNSPPGNVPKPAEKASDSKPAENPKK